jgi:hypothetical protein
MGGCCKEDRFGSAGIGYIMAHANMTHLPSGFIATPLGLHKRLR